MKDSVKILVRSPQLRTSKSIRISRIFPNPPQRTVTKQTDQRGRRRKKIKLLASFCQVKRKKKRMAEATDEPWLSLLSAPPPNVRICVHGVSFHVNKRCIASRSAKLDHLLESKNQIDLTTIDIPGDAETFGLAARFCYGDEPSLSADTVIPLACLASFLEMTEEHSPNNLLNKTLAFISTRILPYWNQTIQAIRSITPPILPHAQHLGLVHACLKSASDKAAADPNVIVRGNRAKSGARRKLFVVEHENLLTEDLTSLSLPLYQLVVLALASSGIPPEQVAQCVHRYAKMWLDEDEIRDRVSTREMIETVEKLMPKKRGAIHVKCLFQLLRSAVFLQASQECRDGFESRIGKQLAEASVEDLRIPMHGYAKETRYDTKCVIRILSHYFSSSLSSLSELEAVSEILEDFVAEVAADENFRKEEFVALLEVLVAALKLIEHRPHDGVYKAVDVYLNAHGFLTQTERDDICRGLDVRRLSVEASKHAVRSERLPVRMVTQVLLVAQLRVREAIGGSREEEEEEEEEKEMSVAERVIELERECVRMRREIDKCGCKGRGKKRGWKLWKEIKDVFGCKKSNDVNSVQCNCQQVSKKAKRA